MPIWYDNFDRADGQLGANWSLKTGTLAVVSNAAKTQFNGLALAGPVSGPGNAMAECVVTTPVGSSGAACPVVKCDATADHYYFGWAQNQTTKMEFRIYSYYDGNYPFIGSYVLNGTPATQGVLRLEYAAGVLRLYWNGAQMCQASNSNNAAYSGIGIRLDQSSVEVSQFSASGDGQPQLIVSPKVVGTADGDQLLSLLGVAVTWTPGTPGAPGFSVNGGALNSQSVASTTNASALFSPPLLPGLVTLSDPVNGLSATITVVAGNYLGTGQGGVGGLSSLAVGWLEAQAAHGGLVLADNDTTDGSVSGLQLKGAFGELLLGAKSSASPSAGYVATADAILTIWSILNGQLAHTSSVDVLQSVIDLRADTTDLRARWATGNDGTEWTAHELVQLLGGEPIANHQDILTAIAGVGGGDDSALLAAIAGVKGDPLATVKTVIDQVFVLSHLGAYDLGDVKDWAEAVRGSGLPTIKGVLDKLGGSGNTIEQRIDALSDLIVTENTIQGMLNMAIAALTGGEGFTLAAVQETVIDAINGLSFPTVSSSVRWPGLSAVTLGGPLALSDGLTIEGPMHGLLFEIVRSQPGGGNYEFGTVRSWSHVGGVIFCTDSGHYERSQSIGPERQIVMPFTMEAAESAILRLNGGFTGTVRTWTRT